MEFNGFNSERLVEANKNPSKKRTAEEGNTCPETLKSNKSSNDHVFEKYSHIENEADDDDDDSNDDSNDEVVVVKEDEDEGESERGGGRAQWGDVGGGEAGEKIAYLKPVTRRVPRVGSEFQAVI